MIYNVVLVSDGQQCDSVITYTLKAVDNLRSISFLIVFIFRAVLSESDSCLVVSDSLQPHGLYSPWNSLGWNTGVGSLSLLQGIFPTQVSRIAGGFFTS